jgi:cold shock CspA family protein
MTRRNTMKDAIVGQIKFVHPNGYGFVSTKDGDVFFHVKGFLKPEVVKAPDGPVVNYLKVGIDPKDIKKDAYVLMLVEEGPKGKAAKSWCFRKAGFESELEVSTMPRYRLLARRTMSSKPYGDPARRRWVTDQWLSSDWVWEGYEYQFDQYRREPGVEYLVYVKAENGWEKCLCPLGRYNGGPLFDLPIDWKQTI